MTNVIAREEIIKEVMKARGYSKKSMELLKLHISDADYNQYKQCVDYIKDDIDKLLK